jgi:hypothetical protein
MMAQDMAWTQQLGNAVLTQRSEVMDAVQRMRQKAKRYGYLAPNGYVNVISDGGYIQILPVDPNVIYVPYYDPVVVFAPPRPGLAVAGAIHFGPAITIGAVFGGWGWWLGSGFLPHDPHRPSSLDSRVGQSVRICSSLCTPMGASGWTAIRSPSAAKKVIP